MVWCGGGGVLVFAAHWPALPPPGRARRPPRRPGGAGHPLPSRLLVGAGRSPTSGRASPPGGDRSGPAPKHAAGPASAGGLSGGDSGGWTGGASTAHLGEGGRNSRHQGVSRGTYGSRKRDFPPISALAPAGHPPETLQGAAAGVDRWGLRPGLSPALGQVGTGTLQGEHEGRSDCPPRAVEPKPAARGPVPILEHWPTRNKVLYWPLIHYQGHSIAVYREVVGSIPTRSGSSDCVQTLRSLLIDRARLWDVLGPHQSRFCSSVG